MSFISKYITMNTRNRVSIESSKCKLKLTRSDVRDLATIQDELTSIMKSRIAQESNAEIIANIASTLSVRFNAKVTAKNILSWTNKVLSHPSVKAVM